MYLFRSKFFRNTLKVSTLNSKDNLNYAPQAKFRKEKNLENSPQISKFRKVYNIVNFSATHYLEIKAKNLTVIILQCETLITQFYNFPTYFDISHLSSKKKPSKQKREHNALLCDGKSRIWHVNQAWSIWLWEPFVGFGVAPKAAWESPASNKQLLLICTCLQFKAIILIIK